uniref:B30.2/SPRY domain-containing protein n=1 Tax=Oryzias latipes TaxID=8090 RepID=A0A3B3HNA5_ORYLA
LGLLAYGETFSCSICLDLLKDPVTIPCGHSYCMKYVACDVCAGRKLKAIKSCLICLASYCEKHLQPHLDAAPLKKHKLVEPFKNLQENICSRHDEVMKMFCRTDQKCICYLCSVDEHRGHDTVSAVEAVNHSADQTVKDSEKIFTDMIRLIQRRSWDVKQQIRSQQQTEVSRVKDLQEELEREITGLKRRDAELKQLSLTEDHNQFLGSTLSSSINVRPLRYFEDVTAAVSELRDKLQGILREERTQKKLTVTCLNVLPPEPKSRADFLKYSCQITLDPDTAHRRLLLSEENRKVTLLEQHQSYSDHPDRFTDWLQVLSKESLIGRCYWEVGRQGKVVYVAVAYKNISRSGNESRFGFNNKSWVLRFSPNSFSFYHNRKKAFISAPASSRVGVYLDHRAGVLSFYSVSQRMTLLHRVHTSFSQPLHAGLWMFYIGETAEFNSNRSLRL